MNLTVFVFKKEWRAAALQLSAGHDGDPVSEQIGFVHEVRGEQDGTAALLALQQVPGGPSGGRVHTRGGLVQHHNLTGSKKQACGVQAWDGGRGTVYRP